MPELPDVTIYVEAIAARTLGHTLRHVRIISPFVLRTFEPPVEAAEGRQVENVGRLGKRIVLSLTGDLHLVFHLMIAGRFRWQRPNAKPPGKIVLATFAWHAAQLSERNPGLFDGIGNAYSDEILHAARLSPIALTHRLSEDEAMQLWEATRVTLERWIVSLREEFKGRFPGAGEITAFRPGFAVHGKFGQPCPVCGTKVARIRYAENETNYCPGCQTGRRLLADRSLSRLLKNDWPRMVE